MVLKSLLSFGLTVGIAIGLNRLTNGAADPVMFIAGSALWWAVRAYYLAEVNTAHKNSEG